MRDNLPLPGEVLCEVVMAFSEPQLVAARLESTQLTVEHSLALLGCCWDRSGRPSLYCEQGTGLKMVLLYALNSSP